MQMPKPAVASLQQENIHNLSTISVNNNRDNMWVICGANQYPEVASHIVVFELGDIS